MSENSWECGLDSTDPEQRRLAVAALASATGQGISQLAIRALGDEDWRVRKEAISVIVAIGPSSTILDELIGTFSTSDNVGLRNAVSEVLAGFGRPAIERISAEIAVLDADGRKLAAEALGRTGHQRAASVLTRMLGDLDVNVRVAAIEALGSLGGTPGRRATERLRGAIGSHVLLERLAALDAINALGIALEWEVLRPIIGEPVLERAALSAAARSSAPGIAELLAEALSRHAANGEIWPVQALADYLSRSREAMYSARPALIALAGDARQFLFGLTMAEDLETRTAALVVLSALGDEQSSHWVLEAAERDELTGVAEHLVDAIAALHPEVLSNLLRGGTACQRAQILRTLSRHPTTLPADTVLDEVARAIEVEEDDSVRVAALEVLAFLSNERCFRSVVERFTKLPNAARRTAMVVLGEMAMRQPDAARDIVDAGAFTGEEWIPVAVLLSALSRGGRPAGSKDMELLSRCLLADEPSVRCAALDALSDIGDGSAADAIAFLLADEEQEVRLAAVRALGRLRSDDQATQVIGKLIDVAQETDDRELLVVAVQAIGETSDPRVLTVLRPLVESSEPSVAVAAVEAVSRLDDARRVEVLILGLAHRDVDVVKTAMRMLARDCDTRVDVCLGECLEHEDWGVRRLAADLLGQRGGDRADGLVRAKRTTEREPLVREALDRALGVIEGSLPPRRSMAAPERGSWRPR
jgi:HEAT repeat protein